MHFVWHRKCVNRKRNMLSSLNFPLNNDVWMMVHSLYNICFINYYQVITDFCVDRKKKQSVQWSIYEVLIAIIDLRGMWLYKCVLDKNYELCAILICLNWCQCMSEAINEPPHSFRGRIQIEAVLLRQFGHFFPTKLGNVSKPNYVFWYTFFYTLFYGTI